jgi:hypothetical protein
VNVCLWCVQELLQLMRSLTSAALSPLNGAIDALMPATEAPASNSSVLYTIHELQLTLNHLDQQIPEVEKLVKQVKDAAGHPLSQDIFYCRAQGILWFRAPLVQGIR